MEKILENLEKEGVRRELIEKVRAFSEAHPADEALRDRVPAPDTFYYGNKVWEEALAALLAGKNILLAGPKATGKNILAENLAAVFGRPAWNISFHISTDAAALVGTDTYDGQKVVFREGPITRSAKCGGFAILDEINMARNEALAVLHSALDVAGRDLARKVGVFRVVLEVAAAKRASLHVHARAEKDLYVLTHSLLTERFADLLREGNIPAGRDRRSRRDAGRRKRRVES